MSCNIDIVFYDGIPINVLRMKCCRFALSSSSSVLFERVHEGNALKCIKMQSNALTAAVNGLTLEGFRF